MASGFSGGGGGPDFYTGIGNGRSAQMMSMNNNHPQQNNPYRAALAGILPEAPSQMMQHRGQDLIGKRSLAEFQHQQYQIQQQQQQQQQQQPQMVGMGLGGLYSNLRNVKPRVNYQHSSPISPLSPVDLSSLSSSSEISSSSHPMNPRYGIPILQQQLRQQQEQRQLQQQRNSNNMMMMGTPNGFGSNVNSYNRFGSNVNSSIPFPNLVQNQNQRPAPGAVMGGVNELFSPQPSPAVEDQTPSDKKILSSRLQELEKQLLLDDDDFISGGTGSDDAVSVVTNSEWSDTIQSLDLIASSGSQNVVVGNGSGNGNVINANVNINNGISPSPTSSSSSCSSTSASPPLITTPRQSIADVATAISDGRTEAASEILTRLAQVSNAIGTPEQRLTAYMTSALRSRVNPTEYPPPVAELYNEDHSRTTQMLYEVSPCFKLGFMAANLAILEAVSETDELKLHVIDFDIGQGGQYVHLLHALAAKTQADKPAVLKITTFTDFGGEDRLKKVGDGLTSLANKLGVRLFFNTTSLSICDLSREKIGVESDESLAVNFAFRLYKLPDESVTTENLRDELLRQVKGLSPKIVTVVEQEMNANTAAFGSRVNEACGYYGVLFESLDATMPRELPARVQIEEGLGRKMANSVACEGRDRVERCEVFGKWRARMGMARFDPKPMSQLVADSLRSKLSTGARGNPGFTVNEQSGGICFGWMGRTLTVASSWR